MISLLARFESARRDDRVVLDARSVRLLEWERITAQVAAHCRNPLAADAVRARRPFASPVSVALAHELADEVARALADADGPPLVDVSGALALIRRPPPVRLEGPDLVHVAAVARELDDLRRWFLARREACPRWGEAAVQMATFDGLVGAIGRALDPDGRIVDGASPLLARLRRAVAGQERAVRSEVGQAM
ncbi:hypothetical protein KDM41_14765, partial [bacterium]|nr:hypothetical protein [bacterium]